MREAHSALDGKLVNTDPRFRGLLEKLVRQYGHLENPEAGARFRAALAEARVSNEEE